MKIIKYKGKTKILFIFLLIYYSCYSNKIIENDKINIRINNIKLINTDYEIIYYNKIDYNNIGSNNIEYYGNTFPIKLEIKIINSEIILQIKKLVNPLIYLDINDREYLARGFWIFESAIPQNCNYFFTLDYDYKIYFRENNTIIFMGIYD